jgi:hypothetical protein
VKEVSGLKDLRDLAAVAAGLCTQHGCKSAPMPGYRKCALCHAKKQTRDRIRNLAKPHGMYREARRESIARGECWIRGCSAPAVRFKKCEAHLTAVQRLTEAQKMMAPARGLYTKGPEYTTVQSHLSSIRHPFGRNANYEGMPFYPEWDKRRGGFAWRGAKWIIEHLGPRPTADHQLHVVNTNIGFWPGNLAWIPRSKHKQTETISQVHIKNQQLKDTIVKLEDEIARLKKSRGLRELSVQP